ncbi:MAG: hypothetical protein GY697_12930, partial [Desulfobacterales bacterium]|nr:hypothetical protein [Desulfobacterales bacterium]
FGMERDHQVEGDVLNTLINDSKGFFVWFFSVFLTGILIGLGAPFWFDIAKRLSAIRKGLQSAAASSEYRLSAKNADGDPKERKKIVNNVLEQVSEEAASSTILVTKGRELLSPDGTISE